MINEYIVTKSGFKIQKNKTEYNEQYYLIENDLLTNLLHREDGPALIKYNSSGDQGIYYSEWRFKGKYHNDNGPARSWTDELDEFFIHGFIHRVKGPALDYSKSKYKTNRNSWYKKNQKHRLNAPAVVPFTPTVYSKYEWWQFGEKIK